MLFAKHFTPYEANLMLPQIKKMVSDILIKGRQLKSLVATGPQPAMEELSHKLIEEIEVLMAELETMGCFFKDWNFEVGLVDFPAIIENEEVLICWRSDEKDVRYYHSLDNGFAGRQPIPEHWLIEVDWKFF